MKLSALFLWMLPVTVMAADSSRTMYGDPIHIAEYVSDPRAAIVEGVRQFGWVVQDEQPGKVVLRLERPNVQVVNAVYYDRDKIWFEDVSDKLLECPKPNKKSSGLKPRPCEISDSTLLRWRINLRRGILKQIQELALNDALADYEASPRRAAVSASAAPK